MSDIVERLKEACVGYPAAKIAWPHRLLHEAIAEIERLCDQARTEEVTMEKYAQMLRQYLGAMGCKVSMLDYDELLEVSKMAFDVPGKNLVEVAVKVKSLTPRERSARVREAILKHWPKPTVLWPAQGNARKLLKKETRP